MVRPMRPLAILATVLGELANCAGTQSYIRNKAVGVAWVFTTWRTRVVHFEAPGAILVDCVHISHCYDRVTLKDWLAHVSSLDRSFGDQLPLLGTDCWRIA